MFAGAYNIIEADSQKMPNEQGEGEFSYAKANKLEEFEKFEGKLVVKFVNSPRGFYYVEVEKISAVPYFLEGIILYPEKFSIFYS